MIRHHLPGTLVQLQLGLTPSQANLLQLLLAFSFSISQHHIDIHGDLLILLILFPPPNAVGYGQTVRRGIVIDVGQVLLHHKGSWLLLDLPSTGRTRLLRPLRHGHCLGLGLGTGGCHLTEIALVGHPRPHRRLPHQQEDPGIADHNTDTGHHEGSNEEELLGGSAVAIVQDGAGADGVVQSESPPNTAPGGYHDGEGGDPCPGHH